jgi:hypothetical protein
MADPKTKTEKLPVIPSGALTAEDIKLLKSPFPRERIGVKQQAFNKEKTRVMLVPYLQHTDVADRLDEVDPSWSSQITHEAYGQGGCAISMSLTIKGVTRANVGEGEEPKGAASDALKRCAMMFGVGRDFYDAGRAWVAYNEQTDKFRTFTYDEYEKGLRGEPGVPTAEGAQSRAAVQGGQSSRPAQNAPGPRAQSAAQSPAPTGPRAVSNLATQLPPRARLNAQIADLAGRLNAPMTEIADWVRHDYGKEPANMTIPELEQFVGILEGELGRKGEPA